MWDAEIPRSKAFSETFRNVKSTNSDLPKNVCLWLSAFYQNSEGSICQLENAGKADCGAALALLMKVLMYQATPGMHSEKWEEMVNIGEYFIDGKSMTFGEILHYDKSNGEDWENLRKRLWFKPKEKNTGTVFLCFWLR